MSFEFSEEIVRTRFFYCGGQCECNTLCRAGHFGRCQKRFNFSDRATSDLLWGWQADHDVPVLVGGPSTLANCRILCVDCHKAKTGIESMFSQLMKIVK